MEKFVITKYEIEIKKGLARRGLEYNINEEKIVSKS